jgi:protein-S-isoprenylcysteine O-methyltransferase Ste14
MNLEHPLVRTVAVSASGILYWAGVYVQARRVRRNIGRSPNLRPRGAKENLLWLGWIFVAGGWIAQPFLLSASPALPGLRACPELPLVGLWLGLALLLAGYGGTLWCYSAMGDAWRIGVNREEKNALITNGPYAHVRHPIYLFQIVMLAGVWCLLPTLVSLALLVIHSLCALAKALDEESHQLRVHGAGYQDYLARTGRFLPRLRKRSPPDR